VVNAIRVQLEAEPSLPFPHRGRYHDEMVDDPHTLDRLGKRLEEVLASGLAEEPVTHAQQVAEVAGILHSTLTARGLIPTLVGGSAIEIHAPGIYMSGDLDLVIEGASDVVAIRDEVFQALGLTRVGRHWRQGELFVETVPGPVAGPAEEVEVAGATFRVVRKEVPLRDRLVGFKHWRHTAYGDQAIAMLIAFGDDLDMDWLEPELRREDALDALQALSGLTSSDVPITHERLLALVDQLNQQKRNE
jgi:hypothetical protein